MNGMGPSVKKLSVVLKFHDYVVKSCVELDIILNSLNMFQMRKLQA